MTSGTTIPPVAPSRLDPWIDAGHHAAPDATRALRRRSVTWLAIGLCVLAAISCVMMLGWPLGYDQGVFASNGDVVARGGAPYRDAWDVKGPLVFYMTAAIQLVFGHHAWGVRLVDVGLALLTGWMLWRRLRVVTSPEAALVAAATWPVVVAALSYDASAQYDVWVGTAILGAVLAMTRPDGYRRRDLLLAGALVGLTSLVKPVFPAFLGVPGLVVLLRRRAPLAAVGELAVLVAGWAIPLCMAAVALAAQGALREAWDVHIMYNLRVYATNSPNPRFPGVSPMKARLYGVVAFLYQPRVAVLLAPAAAGAVTLWRRDRGLAAAVVAWVLGGAALVVLQNKFWVYHWGIVYPGLLLLIAAGVYDGVQTGRAARSPATVVAIAGAAVVAFALWTSGVAIDLRRWALHLAGRQSDAAYDATFLQYGELNPADARAAAAYIRTHTPPGQPFGSWSLHASLPFLAGRPNVSRFQNKRDLSRSIQHPITRAYRTEELARIRSVAPTLVAVDRLGDTATVMQQATGRPPTAAAVLDAEFPELARLIATRYTLAAQFGAIDIYRLRTGPADSTVPPRTEAPGGP